MKRVAPLMLLGSVLLLSSFWGFAQDSKDRKPAEQAKPSKALWQESGQCGACHVEASWRKLVEPPKELFDHATTGFPLRGAHSETDCSSCHLRGLSALSQRCDSCHTDPHAGLHGKNCSECHTEVNWIVPRNWFDHDRTRFPLQGMHAAIACEQCHRNFRTEPPSTAPTECIACHAHDWQRTAGLPVPDHTSGGAAFTVPNCQRCHLNVTPPNTWDGAFVVPP